jgi:outer membrane protein assembly factor BamB
MTLRCLLALVLTAGCRTTDEDLWPDSPHSNQVWQIPQTSWALMETKPGTLVAIDSRDGKIVWKFERPPGPSHEVIRFRPDDLACPPVFTGAGKIGLRYESGLVVLSAKTGKVDWFVELRPAQGPHVCPVATPDSGIVVVVQGGAAIRKLDSKGVHAWTFRFPDGAVARGRPQAMAPSGDVIVRTDHHVFSLNPNGRVNWQRPVEKGSTAR